MGWGMALDVIFRTCQRAYVSILAIISMFNIEQKYYYIIEK